MKNKFLLIVAVLGVIILISPFLSFFPLDLIDESTKEKLNSSALTEINSSLSINDLPGSPTNWTWAKNQGYCTGNGTPDSPYIISEMFFNTSIYAANCLDILNSRKYFIIEDSLFKGHFNFAGIRLANTTNGIIWRNRLYQVTGALLWIYNSSLNIIDHNNASAAFFYGILVDGLFGRCSSNAIFDNVISFNLDTGLQIKGDAKHNQIMANEVYNNSIGIDLLGLAYDNTVSLNIIRENSLYGLKVESNDNQIYQNCFINNALHAIDHGINNAWDHNSQGNYWDNYTGSDANNDGIGDVPYNISGSAGNKDFFPLMSCPRFTIPGGISGYSLVVLFVSGTGIIIGVIYLSLKKKAKLG